MKLKSNRPTIAVVVAIAALVVGFILGAAYKATTDSCHMDSGTVASVIDGDTIQLSNGKHVRYLGIDAPEKDEYLGPEATLKNRQLVEGKTVQLQKGITDRDKYGRLLRYVYSDGVFVNAELIAQGYAHAYIFEPDDQYSQVLVQLEQYAKIRQIGIWSRPDSSASQ
jgi:micrococcal nuclease